MILFIGSIVLLVVYLVSIYFKSSLNSFED